MAAPRLAGHRRRTTVAGIPDLTGRNWTRPSEHQLEGMDSDVVLAGVGHGAIPCVCSHSSSRPSCHSLLPRSGVRSA